MERKGIDKVPASFITDPKVSPDEIQSESRLRPKTLDEFVGQAKVKENLTVFIEAAKQRGEPLDHVLLYGPPGLGKTTLAHIIAHELGVAIRTTSGPVFQNAAELLGILTQIEKRDVVFIDEIHRLSRVVEEHLYPAMEEFRCELIVDKGPHARHYSITIEPFTLVGATTRAGMITPPMRSRFGVVARLDFYRARGSRPHREALRAAPRHRDRRRGDDRDRRSAPAARRASPTGCCAASATSPRSRGRGTSTCEIADYALGMLEVDEKGLNEMDRRLLATIIEKFSGGPVGISSLSVAVSEEAETIEDIYEPFLIQEGLIQRTSRGRMATEAGYRHLKMEKTGGGKQKDLL